MKIDLHSHSDFSDGKHCPAFVISRARKNGVTHLALTDHDCIEGTLDLVRQGVPADINLINGVEISTVWENQEIHVVGLCIDHAHDGLQTLLDSQQKKRWDRIYRIESAMDKAGVQGLATYFANLNCVSPGRSHVADFLISQGKARNRQKAFQLLGKNGRYYAKPDWCTLADAIAQIKGACGLAVLAHPHRYPLSNGKLKRLINEFRDHNGDAIEVSYSNMKSDTINYLAKLSIDVGLWASVGSDFHDANASWMDIGRINALPEMCNRNAIWMHPRWRF